jgi:hypothetical protein
VRRIALLVWLSWACACEAPSVTSQPPVPSAAQLGTSTRWTTIDASQGDARDTVPRLAREARSAGLSPVLYLSAPYTMASVSLRRLRDSVPMRDALDGLAVIEITPELDHERPQTGYEHLITGYWHSFHALDSSGQPTDATLDPWTKNGPCSDGDAEGCAAWIRPWSRRFRGAETAPR